MNAKRSSLTSVLAVWWNLYRFVLVFHIGIGLTAGFPRSPCRQLLAQLIMTQPASLILITSPVSVQ